MKTIDRDNIPHLLECLVRNAVIRWHTSWARLAALWWGVRLGPGCLFFGHPRFRRYPQSGIIIGAGCRFNSSPFSNLIGINRPCILSTLAKGAKIQIGSNCGFSGTVIGCASEIVIGENVRCGANTLITDTDWHTDDQRAGPNAAVVIEDGVWLGVNVTVLKGVTIGKNTFVAAGSLVISSLPSNVVAGGMPARVLREMQEH